MKNEINKQNHKEWKQSISDVSWNIFEMFASSIFLLFWKQIYSFYFQYPLWSCSSSLFWFSSIWGWNGFSSLYVSKISDPFDGFKLLISSVFIKFQTSGVLYNIWWVGRGVTQSQIWWTPSLANYEENYENIWLNLFAIDLVA